MADKKCACGGAPVLVFPCSGGSDVGEITDRAARKMTRDGSGRMYCLAGIGGRVGGILETTKSAAAVLAVDGCPLDCAKKCLAEAGFGNVRHLRLTDMGLQKGSSPADEATVAKVAAEAARKLSDAC